jgi:hypothetical protein
MLVQITAVRGGKDITFEIDGKSPAQVFRDWQAGPLSAGCTRAALGTKPAPVEQRDMPLMQLSDGLRFKTVRCDECGVKTTSVDGGNYLNGSDGGMFVHRSGCSRIKPGHLVVAPDA